MKSQKWKWCKEVGGVCISMWLTRAFKGGLLRWLVLFWKVIANIQVYLSNAQSSNEVWKSTN